MRGLRDGGLGRGAAPCRCPQRGTDWGQCSPSVAFRGTGFSADARAHRPSPVPGSEAPSLLLPPPSPFPVISQRPLGGPCSCSAPEARVPAWAGCVPRTRACEAFAPALSGASPQHLCSLQCLVRGLQGPQMGCGDPREAGVHGGWGTLARPRQLPGLLERQGHQSCCVTLGISLAFSGPQCPQLFNKGTSAQAALPTPWTRLKDSWGTPCEVREAQMVSRPAGMLPGGWARLHAAYGQAPSCHSSW